MTDETGGDDPFAMRDAARSMTRAALRSGAAGAAAPAPGASASPGGASRRRRASGITAGVALMLLVAGGLVLRSRDHPSPHGAQATTRAFAGSITPADEAAILAAPQDRLGVFRLRGAPAILVLAFPSLHQQALTLDRIGAFVEKAGMPHDRVMNDAELASRIEQSGDDFDTFYYGHDYRAADLTRFFATADADATTLDPDERGFEAMLRRQGLLRPDAVGAVISLPPLTEHPPVDAAARATILRHEISHGVYFTDPAYAAYTAHFWSDVMTGAERAAFRKMLGGEGYDTSNEDLMRNEMQAYLVHTPDRRFFDASHMGIDAAALRARFVQGMPEGWLKSETPK